ncbi:uncharacterized protein [Nicotiana tomentosiformis]|uniref:uncharacterized protein n=1 Tax=Nicotiana tomentosiformis TaxID=4098 RepID=UPI00388CD462
MSPPLPHPPQSTSFPSTLFTITPPSNNSVQYYSMLAKGSQSNTTKCTWHPHHQNKINAIFEKKAAKRIKDTLFATRSAGKIPEWLREDIWKKLLTKWNTDEWKKKKSGPTKENRASSKGVSLHLEGSISFAAHKLRLKKEKGEICVMQKSSRRRIRKKGHIMFSFQEDYHKRVEEWKQTQPPSTQSTPDDIVTLWTEAADKVNKGRVYGLGVRRSTGHPNLLLADSSSSQNQEQMKDMRKEIHDLKQQLDSQFEIFVKMQKFMRKYGHDLSYDEDEQTKSNL